MPSEPLADREGLRNLLDDDTLRREIWRLAFQIQRDLPESVIAESQRLEQMVEQKIAQKRARIEALDHELTGLDRILRGLREADGDGEKLRKIVTDRRSVLRLERQKLDRSIQADRMPDQLNRIRQTNNEMNRQKANADFLLRLVGEIEMERQRQPEAPRASACPSPQLIRVRPGKGRASTAHQVEIDGSGFLNGAEAKIGQVPLLNVETVTTDLLRAIVPPDIPAGRQVLTVTNPDGQTGLLADAWLAF